MTTLLAISFSAILKGILGMAVLLAIAFLFSDNKRKINWSLVAKGLAIQFVFAILVLKVPFVEEGLSL